MSLSPAIIPSGSAMASEDVEEQSFFIARLFNVPERLGLAQPILKLLRAMDDVRQGSMQEVDLGRGVRLSPALRRSIIETIQKCAITIIQSSDHSKSAAQTIQTLAEVMKIAG
jgi:hypothetical protein